MSRYSGPPTPFCVDRISTRKERIAKFREYFSTLPAQIEQDLKDFDEEAANDNEHFSELLQMWIVRMKSRFGADKAFTDEALEAGAIEDLLLPCLDHPNKYLAFYSMNALMAVVTNWKEARRRLMAQKNGWFKRLCALIRDGFIMEKNAATFVFVFFSLYFFWFIDFPLLHSGLLFVIIQYAPWRYQFTPEERQEVVHVFIFTFFFFDYYDQFIPQGLKSLSLITAKQLIREAIDRDQPTFKRRGREVFPFDQVCLFSFLLSFFFQDYSLK